MMTFIQQNLIIEWRHVLRRLRRNGSQTLTIVATLALGIGASATMLGIVERLWLRSPGQVDEPQRLRKVMFGGTAAANRIALSSYPVYEHLARDVSAFAGVAAYVPSELSFGSGVEAHAVRAQFVTSNYFSVLGARGGVGRLLRPNSEDGADDNSVVLSHAFWRSRFAADTGVLGRVVTIGDRQFRIIGVAPDAFTGVDIERVDVFVPIAATAQLNEHRDWRTSHASAWLRIVGRLKDSVLDMAASAQATAALRAANYRSGLPSILLASSASTESISAARGAERSFELKVSVALTLVSLLVLLGACANVAFILFARSIEDQHEMAVH